MLKWSYADLRPISYITGAARLSKMTTKNVGKASRASAKPGLAIGSISQFYFRIASFFFKLQPFKIKFDMVYLPTVDQSFFVGVFAQITI